MSDHKKPSLLSLFACKKGISRFVFILIIAVVVMSILVSIPIILYYRSQSKKIGCYAALDTATRQMTDKYLIDGFKSKKEVKEWVGYVMNGWDDLCPGGGNVYVIYDKNAEMPWRLVCGMHGDDKKECCRLNAEWVLDQVKEAVKQAADDGLGLPESIDLSLNGEKLSVILTEEPTELTRGTGTTMGYDGTVAFYGVAGNGAVGENTGLKDGAVCYLSFADPDYCANWEPVDGWSGSAYAKK